MKTKQNSSPEPLAHTSLNECLTFLFKVSILVYTYKVIRLYGVIFHCNIIPLKKIRLFRFVRFILEESHHFATDLQVLQGK